MQSNTKIPNINGELNISDYSQPIKLHCNFEKFWHIWQSPTDKKVTFMKTGKIINQIDESEETSEVFEKYHSNEKTAIEYIKSKITDKRLKGYEFYLDNPKKRKIDNIISSETEKKFSINISPPESNIQAAFYKESHYMFTGEYLEQDNIYFQIERNQNYLKITRGKTNTSQKDVSYHQYSNEEEAKCNALKYLAEKIAVGFTRNKAKFTNTFTQKDLDDFKESVALQMQVQTDSLSSTNHNKQNKSPVPKITVNNPTLTQDSLKILSNEESRGNHFLQLPGSVMNNRQRKQDNYSVGSKISDFSDISEGMRSRNASNSRSPSPANRSTYSNKSNATENLSNNGGGSPLPSGLGKPTSQPHDVLLANTWDETVDPKGYYMSEKLDGVRCLWTGKKMYSRNGNEFFCPDFFTKNWPNSTLDGELWISRNTFQKCVRVVKKRTPEENEWKKIHYLVFDAPGLNLPFKDRYRIMTEEIAKIDNPYIKMVENRLCNSRKDMEEELEKVLALSGEGLMLRNPDSFYERRRSDNLLKVKKFLDDEALVIGYIRRPTGDIKAMQVKLANGKQFKIGGGLTDQERRNPPKIGTKITFKYQNLSEDGIPRFPIYLRPYDKI